MIRKFTIDLAEAPDKIRGYIEDNEKAEEKLLEKVADRHPEKGFAHEDCPQAFEDKFYELREQRAGYEKKLGRIELLLEGDGEDGQASEWDHHRFTFREPSMEDALYIQGRSADASSESGARPSGGRGPNVNATGMAFGASELLDRLLENAPDQAPDGLSDGLPFEVCEYMLDELDKKSGSGEADLGNSYPQEAFEDYDR